MVLDLFQFLNIFILFCHIYQYLNFHDYCKNIIKSRRVPKFYNNQVHMQSQPSAQTPQELAKSLFKQVLPDPKIEQLTKIPSDILKKILKQCSRLFHRKLLKKPNQIMAFLSSYHRLIMSYNDKLSNQSINNMSLHFILLSSYSMIENQQISGAKILLKKALNYIDATQPDAILLTTALNNLCVLWMNDGKYYKAVNVLLQVTEIMESHMKQLKNSKNKSQAMEDSVFLINTYYLLSKSLSKIKQKNCQTYYRELYRFTSQNGLKKSIKYLGKQSFLSKKFIQLTEKDIDIELPIFKKQQQQKSTYEDQLLQHLLRIQQMLKSPREHPIVPPPPPPPPPAPTQSNLESKDLVYQCSRMINNWNAQIRILKQKGQKLGSLVFNCKKGKDTINLIIGEQRLFKLLSQMNVLDILPQECIIPNLTPRQLIQYCIFNFVYVDDNKNLQIFPRAHCFLTTISFPIFGKQSIIFFYHIRHNNFRIAFGAKSQSQTYHLQLQFHQQFIDQMLNLQQQTDHRIYILYDSLMQAKKQNNNMKNIESKTLSIKQGKQGQINKVIVNIFKNLQIFLKNIKTDVNVNQIFKNQYQFLKFVQVQPGSTGNDWSHGRFYFVRYLKGIRGFQVNVQNSYQTHSPQGKAKAKGQILYSSYQFFRDFGISSSVGATKFRCFCHILSKKYDIKSYQNPLTSRDIEIYQQNSISEVKIAFKCFLRKMYSHKNFIHPLTACIISINNQIPVGIKLTGYSPLLCYQVGFFLHLDHQIWKWPQKIQEQPQDYLNNVVEQYGYKREYFLAEWLEKVGFQKIIGLLNIDEKDCFYVDGVNGNFLRMANVIDRLLSK